MGYIIKKIRNLSIKRKLTISYSIIVVFPLIISLLLSNVVLQNIMLDKIGILNDNSIKDTSTVLNRLLDDMAFTLLSISNNGQISEVLSDDNTMPSNQISKIQKYEKQKKIDNIFENIPLSLMTYDTRITILGENQFDYGNYEDYSRYTEAIRKFNWFDEFNKSSSRNILWIGSVPSMDINNNYRLEAAIPIKGRTGSLTNIGLIHISINEKDVYNALESKNETNEIYLIQNNGEIISCKNKTDIKNNISSIVDISNINENIGKWYIDENKDGEKVVVNGVSIDKGNLTLVSIVSYERLIAPMNKIRNILLIINLVCMIFFLLVTSLISNIISKPLIKLSMSMKAVEKGNFDEKVEVVSEDEVGELSQNFNHMLDRVSELLVITREQEILKREAEFEALQAQINPHFLFNTLSSIRWAAAAYGDKKVENMVHALSILLRSSINNGSGMVAIEEEINILRHYLDLVQMKQGVTYKFDCTIDDRFMQYRIPHLLLQPIVENSILHGFEDLKEVGVISINATVLNDVLAIQIIDNGCGIKDNTLEEILEGKQSNINRKKYYKSVGLQNINNRIKLIYGKNYGIDIRNGEKIGAIVTLSLPVKEG